jgi:hypothetical protein
VSHWEAAAPAITPERVQPGLSTPNRPVVAKVTPAQKRRRVVDVGYLPQRSVKVTLIPQNLDLAFGLGCDRLASGWLRQTLTVNGHAIFEGGCYAGVSDFDLAALGVAAGRPATFGLTITGTVGDDGSTSDVIPDHGRIAFSVSEAVPLTEFTKYPFPPRPTQLAGLGCLSVPCDLKLIVSDKADPTRPVTETIDWPRAATIVMVTNAPGILHVRLNGVEVATDDWWDFTVSSLTVYASQWQQAGIDPQPGDRVTIEVIPENRPGDCIVGRGTWPLPRCLARLVAPISPCPRLVSRSRWLLSTASVLWSGPGSGPPS